MSWTFNLEHCNSDIVFYSACEQISKLSGKEGAFVKKLPNGSVVILTNPKDSKFLNKSISSLEEFSLAFLEKNKMYLADADSRTFLEKSWKNQPTLLKSLSTFLAAHPLVQKKEPTVSKQQKEVQAQVEFLKDQWPNGIHYFIQNKGAIVDALIILFKHPIDTGANRSKIVNALSEILTEAKPEDFSHVTTDELFTVLDFAAAKNVPGAENLLGCCHYFGIGVPRDLSMAAFCFDDSALRLQEPIGHYNLGLNLMNNIDPDSYEIMTEDERIKEALLWLHQSAKNGSPFGAKKLGMIYLHGEPLLKVKPNPSKAVDYFRMSAQQGHALGQYHLAKCLSEGIGGPKDTKHAREMYEQAAWQGNPDAQYELGLIYLTPGDERRADAIRLFMQAAEQGHSQALIRLEQLLGKQIENNDQVENIIDAVTFLYKPTAKRGFIYPSIADKILSYFPVLDKLDDQKFSKIIFEKANLCAKNIQEASKKGWKGAMRALAEAEWHGFHKKDLKRDYQPAQEHFLKAIESGDKAAVPRLSLCIVEHKSVTIEPPK